MTPLKENATLRDVQEFVMTMKKDMGFYQEDPYVELVLLMEELGELVKSVRKARKGSSIDPNSQIGSIEEEIADVMVYLTQVANLFDIDMEKAIRDKHISNQSRVWKREA